MSAVALKQKAISYLDNLDDEQTFSVIRFIESMPKEKNSLQNSKTPEERVLATKSLAELDKMIFNPKSENSLDGRKERVEALWRKYESLS